MVENEKQPTDLKGKIEITADQIVNRLRTIVQPPGKKGTWLRHLNDRQLSEVYHRLKMKQTVYHVAKIAQVEWRILPKSETKSLCRALTDFRKKSLGLLAEYGQSFPQTEEKKKFVETEEKKAKRIIERVDGMEQLSWLIAVQAERVQVLADKEKGMLPFKMTDRSVEVLGKLIDTYVGYQVELGLLKAKPREIDLILKKGWDDLLGGALSDDGARLISASMRLLELADKKALLLRKGEDGKYFLEKKGEEGEQCVSNK